MGSRYKPTRSAPPPHSPAVRFCATGGGGLMGIIRAASAFQATPHFIESG